MINSEDVYYIETGNIVETAQVETGYSTTEMYYDSSFVHWLKDKYRNLIALQTEANKNV